MPPHVAYYRAVHCCKICTANVTRLSHCTRDSGVSSMFRVVGSIVVGSTEDALAFARG